MRRRRSAPSRSWATATVITQPPYENSLFSGTVVVTIWLSKDCRAIVRSRAEPARSRSVGRNPRRKRRQVPDIRIGEETIMALKPETRDKLKRVSTATLATALYKRGLRQQFIQNVHPLSPLKESMVGEAFTLRYMPAREDLNPLAAFRDRGHPQRKAVEECPPGAVFMIDSRKDARAASAGGILITRLMVRGVAGVVTDGGFRDSAEI